MIEPKTVLSGPSSRVDPLPLVGWRWTVTDHKGQDRTGWAWRRATAVRRAEQWFRIVGDLWGADLATRYPIDPRPAASVTVTVDAAPAVAAIRRLEEQLRSATAAADDDPRDPRALLATRYPINPTQEPTP